MNTVERLKKLMEDNKMHANDIAIETHIQLPTIRRWLKTGGISLVYERILDSYLTSKNY